MSKTTREFNRRFFSCLKLSKELFTAALDAALPLGPSKQSRLAKSKITANETLMLARALEDRSLRIRAQLSVINALQK